MTHFHLTLPSNSSMDAYPDNTLSSYTVKLPEEIDLTGDWEVGLKEIHFPQSWYNVTQLDGEFIIDTTHLTDRRIAQQEGNSRRISCLLYPGYYNTCEQLAAAFNYTASVSMPLELSDMVTMSYNKINGKFTIKLQHGIRLTLGKPLARMFGLRRNLMISQMSRRVADIRRGIYSLYVYCSICREVIVGDSKVPILRIVPIQGDHGEYVCNSYNYPTYTPLQRKTFNEITIDIRDDTGSKIPFQSGKLMVILHFRKKGIFLQ